MPSNEKREYFRLPVKLSVSCRPYPINNDLPKYLHAFTKDISGGGICIVTSPITLPKGAWLYARMDLESMGYVECKAQMLWTKVEGHNPKTYKSGLTFMDLPPAKEDQIIKYVHHKQLQERQKGVENW